MTEVRLADGDSIERALKLFRRKPSAPRQLKSAAARRRKHKRQFVADTW